MTIEKAKHLVRRFRVGETLTCAQLEECRQTFKTVGMPFPEDLLPAVDAAAAALAPVAVKPADAPEGVIFGWAGERPVTAGEIKAKGKEILVSITRWSPVGEELREVLGLLEWQRTGSRILDEQRGKFHKSAGTASADWKDKINGIRRAQGSEPI